MFQEHPEYALQRPVLEMYRDLYAGGEEFKRNAYLYLSRRQKEPQQVYNERLDRVFYENYVGSIVDWFASTLFRREPQIVVDGTSKSGRQFLLKLSDDCDLRGTNLTEFFRRQVTNAMVYGVSYTLVDFPRVTRSVRTLADEEAAGGRRAYLQGLTPLDIVDWSHDDVGNLNWAVVRTSRLVKESIADPEWLTETRWTYFDRQNFRIFRALTKDGEESAPEQIDEGRHAMAGIARVPLIELRLTDGLWMMRKAAQLQLEHFNKSNALSWALTMGLFAMPVVYSDREFKQMIGESYYIQLGPEDKFGWTEPEGHVYQLASDNLTRLQREIYRICYLLSQAGGVENSQAQSGWSKQRDFAITQEVLRSLGDSVKDTMKNTLRAIELVRGDGLAVDVRGLDEFDIGDFSTELEDGERLLKLGINSPTFARQIQKKLALKYLSDIRPDVKDQIAQEIEGESIDA